MKIEHFAINVEKPLDMAEWYVQNLGMTVVSGQNAAPFTHFIADDSGRVMIEIYNNPADKVPHYSEMDPLILHLAFVTNDPASDMERLIKAGATFESETKMENGNHLIMLRDPWGLALQLCRRGKSLLTDKEK